MMISERFNTKFRLFSGNGSGGSGGGGAGGPDTTTTNANENTSAGPKNPKSQQRVEELTNYYQEQLRNGTMSQGTANGLIKKLEGTKQQNNGVYTTDGLKYLALKNALAETSKDAMAGDPRYQPKPSSSNSNTKVTTTAPNYNPGTPQTNNNNNSTSKKGVEFNFPNPSSMSDDELSKYLKQLQRERESDTGKMFASIYDNAIKRANEEYERRNSQGSKNVDQSAANYADNYAALIDAKKNGDMEAQTKAAKAMMSPEELAEWEALENGYNRQYNVINPVNNTPAQQTNTPVNNTPEEVKQSEPVKEGKTYIPHEVAYSAEGEKGNRFNRQAVADDLNKAFNNLYLIGSGNYYNPNGSANQNLYGMNNIQ